VDLDAYNGIVLLLLGFTSELVRLIESGQELTLADYTRNITSLFIVPGYKVHELKAGGNQISSKAPSLDSYRCTVKDMQDVIKRLTDLLDDTNQFKASLAYIDSICKAGTHNTEHTNFHKLARC